MQRRSADWRMYGFSQSAHVFTIVFALLLTSFTSMVSAQSAHEVTLARALFEEGVTLADKGDWESAADRFSRAHALKPTSGIAFNWASALVETGKLMQASELLRAIARDETATADLRQESEEKLAAITPRLSRLKVHVAESIRSRARVTVDDKDWPKPVWDVAVPVDPGKHVAVCLEGERELVSSELWLEEGEEGTLTLTPPAAPLVAAPAPVLPKPAPAPERSERKPLYKSWVLWTSVGVVVVGGVIAGALLAGKQDSTRLEAATSGNVGPGVVRW